MQIPEWLVAPFDMQTDDICNESDLEDELMEMCEDLEAKALFKSKTLGEYWSNINTVTK